MAFNYVADRGTANSKTADTTLALTPTGTLPVGALAVVYVASDPSGDITPPGSTNPRWKVTDSVGNVWVTLGMHCQNSGDEAGAGIFVCQLTTALTTSDTVTLTSKHTMTAKAMSLVEFSIGEGKKWCVQVAPTVSNNTASDPASLTHTPGASGIEYLWLHALAGEGPNTDAYTWDADYTEITGDGTTGGSADTNMHVRGGWRIASTTADTVDVTSDTADRDYAQVLIAVREVDYDSEFPTIAPVLDDFDRANEDPLGAIWGAGVNGSGKPSLTSVRPGQRGGRTLSSALTARSGSRSPRCPATATRSG